MPDVKISARDTSKFVYTERPFASVMSNYNMSGMGIFAMNSSYTAANTGYSGNQFILPIPVFRSIQSFMPSFQSLSRIGSTTGLDTYTHSTPSDGSFTSRLISEAAKYIGYSEANGGAATFGGSRTRAWCALFVSYCARKCGKEFNFPTVQQFWDWGRAHNRFHTNPKPGDVMIQKGAGASHTGIVEKVENGRVYTIEGNTSDKVARRSYALNDRKITGYVDIS